MPEDLVDGPRDDARPGAQLVADVAGHRVRLASAGLAVGKDGAVEALQHFFHHARHGGGVEPLLGGVGGKDLRR